MIRNRFALIVATLALPMLLGCAGMGAYTANMASQKVQPTTLMTAKKVQRKLFVVVDPNKVKDAFQLSNSPHSVAGFHSFLKASLNEALAGEFESVEFVAPDFDAPAEPHLIADIKVDGIEGRNHDAGGLTYVILHLQWGFALRASEAEEYLFSFAGVGRSEETYRTLDEGIQQAMKSALHGFLAGYTEKEIHKELRALDDAGSEAAGADGASDI
jgi:hypothetical protein